jgi:hypothetical protein
MNANSRRLVFSSMVELKQRHASTIGPISPIGSISCPPQDTLFERFFLALDNEIDRARYLCGTRRTSALAAKLGRRLIRAGGWQIAKRVIKPIPVVGSAFALFLAGYEIRKKGLLPGSIHVGLDIIPVVGTAKNVLEIFTGDLIPDKRPNGTSPEKA